MKNGAGVEKGKLRNDVIFIAIILLIAAVGAVYLFFFRAEGDTVRVTVDGDIYAVYSLTDDVYEYIITGDDGENSNLLVIKDGRAYVESASCPDGICVNHHAIYRDGESIVCLPNKVVVTVVKEKDSEQVDIVA